MAARSTLSKADQIYNEVREQLLSGNYEFGQVLSTYALAEQLGVSRRPVMDAMMRLETAGFLVILRQVGCQVIVPEERTVREHFTVAGFLEGAGARLAALNATDNDLHGIKRAHRWCAHQVEDNNHHGFAQSNRQFHAAVLETGGNQRLAQLAKDAWDLSDFYLGARCTTDLDKAHHEHEQILDAITNREDDHARKLMEQHLHEMCSQVRPFTGSIDLTV